MFFQLKFRKPHPKAGITNNPTFRSHLAVSVPLFHFLGMDTDLLSNVYLFVKYWEADVIFNIQIFTAVQYYDT